MKRFDYSFNLRSLRSANSNPFHSVVAQAIQGYQMLKRFERRWTEEQFINAMKECLSNGYVITNVFKRPAPESGVPQGVSIEDGELYYLDGLDWKIRNI